MIRILISDAAYAAIAGRAPSADDRQSGAGRYGPAPAGFAAIWLLPAVIELLRASQQPSETYSDTILRTAREG